MSEIQRSEQAFALPTQRMLPVIERIGSQNVEITFLGPNSAGYPTWILWNSSEPTMIGLLTQGGIGFVFEQRTSGGVMVHEHLQIEQVKKAIES